MNKPMIGLLLGGALGVLDGSTAWFTPEARDQMLGIIIGSTGKGLVAGLITGFIARKLKSLPLGVATGLLVAALVTAPIAMGTDPKTGKSYFWQIMLPGCLVGAIVGFATQKLPKLESARQG